MLKKSSANPKTLCYRKGRILKNEREEKIGYQVQEITTSLTAKE